MTTAAFVSCAKYNRTGSLECPEPFVEVKANDDTILPHDVRTALAERGWVIEDGEHYCPRHRPDDAGIPFDIPFPDGEYHPIANSGWEARTLLGTSRLEVRPIREEPKQ